MDAQQQGHSNEYTIQSSLVPTKPLTDTEVFKGPEVIPAKEVVASSYEIPKPRYLSDILRDEEVVKLMSKGKGRNILNTKVSDRCVLHYEQKECGCVTL